MYAGQRFMRAVLARLGELAMLLALAVGSPVRADDACPFACGDLNGDGGIDLADYDLLAECFGQTPDTSTACSCSDMDGSGAIDLRDFALYALVFDRSSDEAPPDCTGAVGSAAELTAYRPGHGGGYAPFLRTAVADADEDSETRGPGIRINAPGDSDPSGEDDLIEVEVTIDRPGAQVALRRSDPALQVWTTRNKQPGSQIAFVNEKSGALPFLPSAVQLTLWVEWASAAHGTADLLLEPPAVSTIKDALTFHTFHGIVVALGGEGQVPSDPADPNSGTFVIATALYRQGYDVHMFDEDGVAADGSGVVYNEVVNAVRNRGVSQVGIFGYSHGGGSTYDLADRLDINRPTIGVFEIEFTSYVDSVSNDSDLDIAQELRRPPSSAYHVNHYQHGSFFENLGLDGGPVPNSVPPPTGLDVETTPWGAGATHFDVDDFVQVRAFIETSLTPRVTR
jgi:hypothetical protein